MKITIVSDASPLIYFAKVNQLTILAQVAGQIMIPPAVYQEAVDAGNRRRKPDAVRIANAIEKQLITRLELTEQEMELTEMLTLNPRLGRGECEVIACAVHRHLTALLHDRKARRVATTHSVGTMQATDILFLALLRRHISLNDFKTVLRDLAVLIGMSAATLLERETIAEEIARQFRFRDE